jgi:hypothetical protein
MHSSKCINKWTMGKSSLKLIKINLLFRICIRHCQEDLILVSIGPVYPLTNSMKQKISLSSGQPFMEPNGSLLCWQRVFHCILSWARWILCAISLRYNIILPSHLFLPFKVSNTYFVCSSHLCERYMPFSSHSPDLITLILSGNCEAPRPFSSVMLLLPLIYVWIFLSAPCSQSFFFL